MDVSVIIVNYNVEHFLSQCLLSVRAGVAVLEQAGYAAEVFVVDNNSVDGSCAMVRRQFPEVHLIDSKENLGFSKGNNLAIRQSKGRWVLLLNPDTIIQEDTLLKCLEYADARPSFGRIGRSHGRWCRPLPAGIEARHSNPERGLLEDFGAVPLGPSFCSAQPLLPGEFVKRRIPAHRDFERRLHVDAGVGTR